MPGDGNEAANGAREAMKCDPAPRRFTWEELSKLNGRHNAHVAVRGKVRGRIQALRDGVLFRCWRVNFLVISSYTLLTGLTLGIH